MNVTLYSNNVIYIIHYKNRNFNREFTLFLNVLKITVF